MISLKINNSDLERVLIRMPDLVKVEVGDALDHASRSFLKTFAERRLNAPVWHKSTPSQGTVKNRAGFFKGFKRLFSFPGTEKGMGVSVFTPSKLAQKQEEGASTSKAEGIPVPLSFAGEATMTSKGRVKKSLQNLERSRTIRPIKFKGQVYLTRVFKGSKRVMPLFVMKKQVDLKPRLEFYQTFRDMQPSLYQIIAKRLIKGIVRAWENG
jgi:hypothetical protein